MQHKFFELVFCHFVDFIRYEVLPHLLSSECYEPHKIEVVVDVEVVCPSQ